MTRVTQLIQDDPLHTVKDIVAVDDHVTKEQAYAKLSKRAHNRILFWASLARLTEAHWLKANGWHQLAHGWWGLPDWHPKYGLGPYEQNHAANSQRHYNVKGQEVKPPRPLPRPPVMFASARVEPRMLLCYSVMFTAMGSMEWKFSLRDLAGSLIVVAAFGYAVYQSRQYRRELQFEEAERLLRSRESERPYGRNGRNRDRG